MPPPVQKAETRISDADAEMIQKAVIWKDQHIIALNKPPGLPSQGGFGAGDRHVDGLSEALKFGYRDKPSWCTGWTRIPRASCCWRAPTGSARALSEAFRHRDTRKIHWAAVAGVPSPKMGTIRYGLVRAHRDTGAAARARR